MIFAPASFEIDCPSADSITTSPPATSAYPTVNPVRELIRTWCRTTPEMGASGSPAIVPAEVLPVAVRFSIVMS
jgi:hypothetical protein